LVSDRFDLVPLNVISLFSNILLNLENISNRWSQISRGTIIPKQEFINAIKIILDSTFFSFNNKIYKQKFGTPMGSPLSPVIADIVMQDLEKRALYRYVDHILTAVLRSKTKELLNSFNSLHPRMQFTIEIGGNRLNFLDAMIINNNNLIEFDWYMKPTFSGRILSFLSDHPLTQERGVIMNMTDRAFLLSHPKFHQKKLQFHYRHTIE